MPLLSIETNQNLSDDGIQSLLEDASCQLSQWLGKPERYVMVKFSHNPHMRFGGDTAPLAYLECKSLRLPEDRTAELSSHLTKLIQKHVGISADRIYIEFSSPPRHLWGFNGNTF